MITSPPACQMNIWMGGQPLNEVPHWVTLPEASLMVSFLAASLKVSQVQLSSGGLMPAFWNIQRCSRA